jgi:hypothetical protein
MSFSELVDNASRALAGLLRLLPEVMDRDRRWDRSTNRQPIVAALDHFVELAVGLLLYPAMAGAAHRLAGELRSRWGEAETEMPLHPAFSRT